ncbi:uncharacterized protein LOC100831281 [Brachypodium distachyon]|uniref:uncharacterized protein LOC100831281 n=1 Tax=Brachypodium distachyon TaxID=15368 RepID=UPI000D0D8F8F|nr:uncharacterized protein LOC100831281 [Brachypodium distachyon]XP_024318520.1 uncharacterized protein LOC100831281 [Brachypodium distachyon]XP_024318521.1 uncharacterized protein LOC100831281 [Brachypodium distachyon]|eukprot:XP_024318519.1 uncharacterized protein LOC100831281 [Brachypodium distachyon]
MNAVVVLKYGGSNELDQPPTIYRVPQELKRSCKQAFLPVAVELGLFAHPYRWTGSEHAIQHYKWCCVRRLISRHHLLQEPERTPALLRHCLDALESLEPRIRSSYHPRQQSYKVSSQELMCNMLLDGCFILHRLLKYARINRLEAFPAGLGRLNFSEQEDDDDDDWTQLFGRCWVWGFVTCDLLLLENQVPFFVVQKFSRSSGRTLMRAATSSWLAHCISFDPSGRRGCNPPISPAMRCTTSCTSSTALSDSRKKKLHLVINAGTWCPHQSSHSGYRAPGSWRRLVSSSGQGRPLMRQASST